MKSHHYHHVLLFPSAAWQSGRQQPRHLTQGTLKLSAPENVKSGCFPASPLIPFTTFLIPRLSGSLCLSLTLSLVTEMPRNGSHLYLASCSAVRQSHTHNGCMWLGYFQMCSVASCPFASWSGASRSRPRVLAFLVSAALSSFPVLADMTLQSDLP